jgi:endonuclease/exonuclease/phosphatase family metal-dependent hydrolase
VASFNILHGACRYNGPVDNARLCDAVASLDADIVALQEVDRTQRRSHGAHQAAEIAAATGAATYRFAPALIGELSTGRRAATGADDDPASTVPAYGVALVSRWPVRSWLVVHLPVLPPRGHGVHVGRVPVLPDDEPRVLLAGVLEGPAGPFTVATAHLSLRPGWQELQLVRALRAVGRLPGPRLLLGDFNQPPAVVVPMAAAAGWRSLASVKTFPAGAPTRQIDHVLVRPRHPGTVVGVEARELPVSDHRALVVDLQGLRSPGDVTDRYR